MRILNDYGLWGSRVLMYEDCDDINYVVNIMKEQRINGLMLSPEIVELPVINETDFINEIHITGNKIKNISSLYSFDKIQYLHVLNKDNVRLDLSYFPTLREAVLIKRNGLDNLFNHNSLEKIILIDFKEKKEHCVERSFLQSLEIKNSDIRSIPDLSSAVSLKSVKLTGLSHVSEASFLSELKNIEEISLSLCKRLSPSIIDNINNLLSLKRLSLSKMGDIPSLVKINNLVNLNKLFITENTKITDGRIRFLLYMRMLSYLIVQGYDHYDINTIELMHSIKNKQLHKN